MFSAKLQYGVISGGGVDKCLPTPDREPVTDQRRDAPKVSQTW